ncbi:MAG: hypothetical protein ACRD68_17235, partial [Pyrinomonadaceae bacterium]
TQMAGDLLGAAWLKGFGAATTTAPAPKVFSAVRGLETYSTDFYLEWTDTGGATRSVKVTPEIYSRLRGPYNRRNVYGAALAYGPVLAADRRSRPMLESVMKYALCGGAIVARTRRRSVEYVRPRERALRAAAGYRPGRPASCGGRSLP